MLNHDCSSALLVEEVPEGAVVVLVKSSVDEWVEEGVGVAKPKENTLPGRWYMPREEWCDQLSQKERDPAEDENADQDSHHQCCTALLLLPPCLTVCLECHSGMTDRKGCLRTLPSRLFRL